MSNDRRGVFANAAAWLARLTCSSVSCALDAAASASVSSVMLVALTQLIWLLGTDAAASCFSASATKASAAAALPARGGALLVCAGAAAVQSRPASAASETVVRIMASSLFL